MSTLQTSAHVSDTLCAVMAGGRLVLAYSEGSSLADIISRGAQLSLDAPTLRALAAVLAVLSAAGPTAADLDLLAAAALDAAERIETSPPPETTHADPA